MNTEPKKTVETAMIATRLPAEYATAFQELAKQNGTTPSRILSTFIKSQLKDRQTEPAPTGTNVAVLSYRNVDRLKHEVAFHNPKHLNPDKMLNHILDRYFEMVEDVRGTTE